MLVVWLLAFGRTAGLPGLLASPTVQADEPSVELGVDIAAIAASFPIGFAAGVAATEVLLGVTLLVVLLVQDAVAEEAGKANLPGVPLLLPQGLG